MFKKLDAVCFLCCLFCSVTRALEVIGLYTRPSVSGLGRGTAAVSKNVTSSARRASAVKVFAMWYTCATLLLVSCAVVEAAELVTTETVIPVTTTRSPPRTLDRQAAELAWKTWLQSPESGNQNGPPRRITTKSLFITPLICPKGQRLDRNGCVQVVTVNKDEHERILLDQLNALFNPTPSGGELYDYGDDELGPLQLSIPIGLDPQAAPLQGQEPLDQVQGSYGNFDKKDGNNNGAASIEAELELLKLQNSRNDTALPDGAGVLNHNVLTNLHFAEKPKRDSPLNATDIEAVNNMAEQGQKEVVFGHVNVDPVLYNIEVQNYQTDSTENTPTTQPDVENLTTKTNEINNEKSTQPLKTDQSEGNKTNTLTHVLKKDGDHSQLKPENDYSDIGEAIKIISRYAEVTTDDNFSKEQKKQAVNEDSVLGTRTKLQHRRKPPAAEVADKIQAELPNVQSPTHGDYVKNGIVYRYPWPSQHYPTPPPGYPFRHLQDYWPGQNKFGGVYNNHENPRRHHHTFPHNFRARSYGSYPGIEPYPEPLKRYIHRITQHHSSPLRSQTTNQDLYSLLGLKHWFSSEDTTKR